MRRTDDAIARLKVAIDLNPNLTWAHANLGLALASSGRGDEAVAPLSEALRLSPRAQNNFTYHHLMGFALFVAGRYEEGLASADTSLRKNSGLPGAYRVRAACLSQLGRIERGKGSARRISPPQPRCDCHLDKGASAVEAARRSRTLHRRPQAGRVARQLVEAGPAELRSYSQPRKRMKARRESASGTNRACRRVRKHFRYWRFRRNAVAMPILLILTQLGRRKDRLGAAANRSSEACPLPCCYAAL